MERKKMDNWSRWMQFSCRMVIYAMDHTPERKNKVLKAVIEFINSYRNTEIVGWDAEHEENGYMSDYIEDQFEDGLQYKHDDIVQTKFFRDICCAVRAGIDMVLPEQWQGGVIGFSVGDVRKMYPEGFPQWLQETFDKEFKKPISEAPDEIGIWL